MQVASPEAVVSRMKEICRREGLALTAQRRAILDELCGRTDHPTADDLYEAIQPRVPGLSRTTVYRVLDTLVDLGVLKKVAHSGGAARFDPNTKRHHHLICESCGDLGDLPSSLVPDIPVGRVPSEGFEIRDYSIQFTGLCARCRKKAQRTSKRRR
jgi:Fur family peroxide stress response transcriptional regulator